MTGKADAVRVVSQQFKDRTNTVIEGVMAHLRDENAKEILGPSLSPLIGRGSLKSIVTFALYADVLRMVRDMVMADGEISDEEVQESLGLLQVLAGGFAKVRSKDYGAYASLSHTNARDFLAFYTADKGLFGYANEATKWAGVELCRNIQSHCGESGPLEAFGSSLVAWGEAIAGSDSQDPREQIMLSTLRETCGQCQSIDAAEQGDEVTEWSEADVISLVSEAIKSFANDDSAVLNPDEYLRELGERLGVEICDDEFEEIAFHIEEQLGVELLPDFEEQLRCVCSIREYAAVVQTAIRENGTALQLSSTAPSPLSTPASPGGGTAATTGGKSASQGSGDAQRSEAIFADFQEVFRRGVQRREWLREHAAPAIAAVRKAAEEGSPRARFILACCLWCGEGLEEDSKAAVELFSPLAEAGMPEAQTLLGTAYHLGEGVRRKGKEALRWLQQAAESREPSALATLAKCYYIGDLVDEDNERAVSLAKMAADGGSVVALTLLATLHERGHGVPQDAAQAAAFAKMAAERGDSDGQCIYGGYLFHGQGVTKDLAESEKWLRIAAGNGDDEAAEFLQSNFVDFEGFGQDPACTNLTLLTELTVPQAKKLAATPWFLDLSSLQSLTDEVCEILKTHQGGMSLMSLRDISDAAASSLAEHRGPIYLNAESVGESAFNLITDRIAASLGINREE